jgi:hypothetical protein
MSVRRIEIVLSLFLVAAGLVSAQTVSAAHRRTLDELTDEAAFIVHGHVVGVRVEPHPQLHNLQTVVVSMQIDDVLKGDVPREFTFRQFLWDVRSIHDGAGYRKRQELMLFLRPPSSYGLTSPAGLQQGRFAIQRDSAGHVTAVNGDNNIGLFATLPKAAQRRGAMLPAAALALATQAAGPVPLADLKQAVRSLSRRPQ